MTVLEWLISGEPSVSRLVRKNLIEEPIDMSVNGWVERYLSLYDKDKRQWGKGVYSPKWDSTFYTLLELTELEVPKDNPIFQDGIKHLIELVWTKYRSWGDICMTAMMISMGVYAGIEEHNIQQMTSYILKHQLPDGGFNCQSVKREVHSSSIHTTLSCLIAFSDLKQSHYSIDFEKIRKIEKESREFLLRKHLFRRETNHDVIQKQIIYFHYPTRWKYDVLKVLVYFAKEKVPFDPRMEEGLLLLKKRFNKGKLPKGPVIEGRLHFQLEGEDVSRMNTYRGLLVLKEYDPELYINILNKEMT